MTEMHAIRILTVELMESDEMNHGKFEVQFELYRSSEAKIGTGMLISVIVDTHWSDVIATALRSLKASFKAWAACCVEVKDGIIISMEIPDQDAIKEGT